MKPRNGNISTRPMIEKMVKGSVMGSPEGSDALGVLSVLGVIGEDIMCEIGLLICLESGVVLYCILSGASTRVFMPWRDLWFETVILRHGCRAQSPRYCLRHGPASRNSGNKRLSHKSVPKSLTDS